jgi:hypothetical protein
MVVGTPNLDVELSVKVGHTVEVRRRAQLVIIYALLLDRLIIGLFGRVFHAITFLAMSPALKR